jgi:hypothetical protein
MANKNLGWMVFFGLLGFILSGCGLDALEEEDAPVLNAADGAVVSYGYADAASSTVCFVCHADAAQPAGLAPVFGDSAADGWLDGPHANDHSMDSHHNELDLAPDNVGFPDYGYFSDSTCATCHDRHGDGMTIAAFAAETGITTLGRENRPIVGCEGCHGSSKDHADIGASLVQYAAPGAEGCQPCHNDTFPDGHLKYHPEGDRIYEDYIASPHAHSANSHIVESDGLRQACSKCHTDEGAKKYRNTPYFALFSLPNEDVTYSDVQCRTCHDAHNPDTLLKSATASNSAEYETCTNCHMDQGMIHGVNSGHSWTGPHADPGDPDAGIGNFDASEIIYDTHFDNPDTPDRNSRGQALGGTGGIDGYVLDTSNDHVCRDCHNVHSADNTINEQWAKSAHGGHILDVKERAFLNTSDADPDVAIQNAEKVINGTDFYGAVTSETGDAWVHYQWKDMGNVLDPDPSEGRRACQQCHTSTGYKSYMTNPAIYNALTDNVFTAISNQAELLYCWACHSDSAGGLRDKYKFSDTTSYDEPAGRVASVPDLSGSNVCMACHSGRASGYEAIKTSSVIFNDTSFKNPHYLAAGGTVFKTTGYEYNGVSYTGWFQHDSIGSEENGPCVGCHMNHEEGHTFEAVEKDSVTHEITAVTAFEDTCSECHGGTIQGDIEVLREGYEAALDELEAALAAKDIIYAPAYPYFYNAGGYQAGYSGDCFKNVAKRNWKTGGTYTYSYSAGPPARCSNVGPSIIGTAGTGRNNMGAAFNLALLHHEPGAYVHNSQYARRLVFDSIDWIDNNILDGTISITNTTALGWLGGTSRP